MSSAPSHLILALSSFFLGLRHGIDLDHIAAISDIIGSCENKRQSFIFGSLYAVGHASIIIALGLLAVIVGVQLPGWVDDVMEPVVGITLLLLGIWLIFSLLLHGKNFRFKSRWMMIFTSIERIYTFFHDKIAHKHIHSHVVYTQEYGIKTTFLIGIIHGIGAETPTQMLLFITVAGVGGTIIGSLFVFLFVVGLLISNTLIILVTTTGYTFIEKNASLKILLGSITAVFSLIVGILFLLHKGSYLPVLFGG